jgi:two-component system, OmpR family, sensor histidine kinase BaeS
MRLNIASKIAAGIIGVVLLSVGTMAWISSQNLKNGFITYLQELESHDLEALGKLLATDYQQNGNFNRFQDNRRAMRDLVDQIRPVPPTSDGDLPPPQPQPQNTRPRPDNLPGRYALPRRPMQQEQAREFGAPGRPPPIDPTGFGQRLSLFDQNGIALIGPQHGAVGHEQDIVVENHVVGSLKLAPLRTMANANGSGFVRNQIRQTIWLATGLALFSTLFSLWLARHLLRPVVSLRSVTKRLAQGQFDARAKVMSQDELGELAEQVNAMAQSLQQNESQRRKMLSNISHDLRTPLTVIRGEIEAMLDGIRHIDPAGLNSLHEEVLHLNKLVDDIHQINLADSGELIFQLKRIDFGLFLQDTLERYRPSIEKAKLTMLMQLPPEPLYINADTGRLNQIVANLLDNSIRYTDAGGTLQCTLQRSGPIMELSIEDSAPGAPHGTHARLFERLYRVDHARSRERGGSGLGLSICKALVETHNGKIEALPSVLGGIKIVIRLPAIP